jgi:hypothetical protein
LVLKNRDVKSSLSYSHTPWQTSTSDRIRPTLEE